MNPIIGIVVKQLFFFALLVRIVQILLLTYTGSPDRISLSSYFAESALQEHRSSNWLNSEVNVLAGLEN